MDSFLKLASEASNNGGSKEVEGEIKGKTD
jgi:hypothetical protein